MPMPKLGEQFFMYSFSGKIREPELQTVVRVSECGKKIQRYEESYVWWDWEKELQGYVMPVTKLHKLLSGVE